MNIFNDSDNSHAFKHGHGMASRYRDKI